MPITVCHLPPGTSKWNRIEHRLFSFITGNWRGKPLVSHQVIVQLIAATTTTTGLKVRCELDPNAYPAGVKVSDEEIEAVNLTPPRLSRRMELYSQAKPAPADAIVCGQCLSFVLQPNDHDLDGNPVSRHLRDRLDFTILGSRLVIASSRNRALLDSAARSFQELPAPAGNVTVGASLSLGVTGGGRGAPAGDNTEPARAATPDHKVPSASMRSRADLLAPGQSQCFESQRYCGSLSLCRVPRLRKTPSKTLSRFTASRLCSVVQSGSAMRTDRGPALGRF